MATFKVFHSTIPSVNYIFGNGKAASFIGGRFATDVDSEISALNYEVKLGHPHITIDPNDMEADSATLDPIAGLREKIIAEYLAATVAASDPTNDRGTSTQSPLKPSSTQDIASAAAGGSGAVLAAKVNFIATTSTLK